MFAKSEEHEDEQLQQAIDTLYEDMKQHDGHDAEYEKIVDQLTKLYALKEEKPERRVSPDTLALIAGNLVGILLIVGHERANVITSKALNFVSKLR